MGSVQPLGCGYERSDSDFFLTQATQIRTLSFRPRPLEFTEIALGGLGFRCVEATHPTIFASNPVRVPWPVHLPPASSRLHLTWTPLLFANGRRSLAPIPTFTLEMTPMMGVYKQGFQPNRAETLAFIDAVDRSRTDTAVTNPHEYWLRGRLGYFQRYRTCNITVVQKSVDPVLLFQFNHSKNRNEASIKVDPNLMN